MLTPHIYLTIDTSYNRTINRLNGNIVTGYSEMDDLQIGQDAISTFPNPSSNRISVLEKGINNIKLLNSFGQFVFSVKPKNKRTTINIGDLASGIYFLIIQVDGQIINRRFIKK
jgi:hypothetical protein